MIYSFSAILGSTLFALGLLGISLSASSADAVALRSSALHGVLSLLTGIIALMATVERRRVARRICLAVATVHATIIVIAFSAAVSTHPFFVFGVTDLCVSALVVASCVAAACRRRSSPRPGHVIQQRRIELGTAVKVGATAVPLAASAPLTTPTESVS